MRCPKSIGIRDENPVLGIELRELWQPFWEFEQLRAENSNNKEADTINQPHASPIIIHCSGPGKYLTSKRINNAASFRYLRLTAVAY